MESFWTNAEAVIALLIAALGGGIWIGKVQEHKTEVTKFMGEIRVKIDRIIARLPSTLLEGNSPLRLNEMGQTISGQIDAQSWAEQTATKLVELVRGKEAFEIEQVSFEYVNDNYQPDEAMDRLLHRAAYEHGIPVWDVRAVLAVVLRDHLLKIIESSTPDAGETANPAHP